MHLGVVQPPHFTVAGPLIFPVLRIEGNLSAMLITAPYFERHRVRNLGQCDIRNDRRETCKQKQPSKHHRFHDSLHDSKAVFHLLSGGDGPAVNFSSHAHTLSDRHQGHRRHLQSLADARSISVRNRQSYWTSDRSLCSTARIAGKPHTRRSIRPIFSCNSNRRRISG